tara:strand:+ start:797 stop:1366 length:570 start_codon:yes stop_codon:yes gene_type:complete
VVQRRGNRAGVNTNKDKTPNWKEGAVRSVSSMGTDYTVRYKNGKWYRVKKDGSLAKSPVVGNIANQANKPSSKYAVTMSSSKANQDAVFAAAQKMFKKGAGSSGLKIADNKNLTKKNNGTIKVVKSDKKEKGKKTWKDYTTVAAAQRAGLNYFMGRDGKKKIAITKEQLKKKKMTLTQYANRELGKKKA